jgi:RES domain-containing protein
VIDALYLTSDEDGMWAEWYRYLAELAVEPLKAMPVVILQTDVPALTVADLSDADRLARVGLYMPEPRRGDWPPFQAVGERLHAEGWAGVMAPSAARPLSLNLVVFLPGHWPPAVASLRVVRTVSTPPPPPTGMRT